MIFFCLSFQHYRLAGCVLLAKAGKLVHLRMELLLWDPSIWPAIWSVDSIALISPLVVVYEIFHQMFPLP